MSIPACSDSRLASVDEQQFCDLLGNFFRPYLAEVSSTQESDCIRHSLEHFAFYLRNIYHKNVYTEFIFSLFELFRTINSDLILRSLKEFVRGRVIGYAPPPVHFSDDMDTILCTVIKDDWTIDYNFIRSSFFGDYEVMSRLFRYGVRIAFVDEDEIIKLTSHSLGSFPTTDDDPSWMMGYGPIENDLKKNYSTTNDMKRLSLISLAANIGLIEHGRRFEESTKSLMLLFETITDPFITTEELSRLINIVTRCCNQESLNEKVCNKFAEDFPSSKDALTPRSLKHLSRCEIRDSLRKAKQLPHGIWSLELPKDVRNYVLIQRREDEFYPKYVSFLSSGKSPPDDSCSLQE